MDTYFLQSNGKELAAEIEAVTKNVISGQSISLLAIGR